MSSQRNIPEEKIASGAPSELWLICPICDQPNHAGTLHCRYCWGASLYSVTPVTSEELAVITKRYLIRQRRWRTARTLSIAIGAPALLFAVVFFYIYSFTDVVFAPRAQMSSSSLPGEWAMYRHDVSRTGSTDLSTVNPQGTLKWSFQAGAEIHSSPTVVGDTVYFGSRDHKFYTLDADTGELRWVFQTGSWVESSPAVVNGVVYFGSNDGNLYALDAGTGRELWHFQMHYAVKSSPAVADGIVYIGGDDYFVYAIDAKTGTKIWEYETDSHVMSSPVVANGIVYVGSMDLSLYALHATNGRFRLRFKAWEVVSSPAVSEGVVYFNSRSHLFAVDGKARNWPWEHDLRGWWIQFYAFRLAPPPPPISGYMWRVRIGINSTTTPIVVGDTLYTAGDNRLYRIDLAAGKPVWTFPAGAVINSSPALANNIIYVGADNGRLYAVNAADGKKLWEFQTGGKIGSSPVCARGVVYVGADDGKLYAIK